MKTQHIKFTTQRAKRLPGVLAASIGAFLVALALFVATSSPVLAVDAVWLPNPGSGDWNTGTNWSTSPSAPVNPGDTATFDTSTQTSLTVSSGATVESITFQPGASAFTISTTMGLTIQGAGIVNNSGKMQTIINFFSTGFFNTSTAGNATIINEGTASTHVPPGTTVFSNTSSAGSATIINLSFGVKGGSTFFEDRRREIPAPKTDLAQQASRLTDC